MEKAVFNLDVEQLYLVFEALSERKTLLSNAPHLTSSLPIMMVGTGPGVMNEWSLVYCDHSHSNREFVVSALLQVVGGSALLDGTKG